MAQQEIRWGVFGPGRIAEKFGKGINVVKGATLYAVASRNPERGKRFAKSFGVKQVYDSYQALAEDPQVDVVYIATPHNFHYQNARLCLEAGKHVLCEKPLTVNAAESERLFALAKQRDLFIMEGMWTYFLPVYQQVREWLDGGEIGEVRLMTSTFGFQPLRDEKDRWLNPDLAGGALLDIGIYNLAVSMWVTQKEVQAFDVRGIVGQTGVDELVAGTLEFPGGTISQFSCTFLSRTANDFFIYGTRGRIQIHAPFWAATKASLDTGTGENTVTRELKAGGFEYQIDEVSRCLRAGLLESPVMPHRQTMASMRLMDAMRAELGVVYPFE
jgi:predicted dehydrogenase